MKIKSPLKKCATCAAIAVGILFEIVEYVWHVALYGGLAYIGYILRDPSHTWYCRAFGYVLMLNAVGVLWHLIMFIVFIISCAISIINPEPTNE